MQVKPGRRGPDLILRNTGPPPPSKVRGMKKTPSHQGSYLPPLRHDRQVFRTARRRRRDWLAWGLAAALALALLALAGQLLLSFLVRD